MRFGGEGTDLLPAREKKSRVFPRNKGRARINFNGIRATQLHSARREREEQANRSIAPEFASLQSDSVAIWVYRKIIRLGGSLLLRYC